MATFITYTEFLEETGMTSKLQDSVESALNFAKEQVLHNLFTYKEYKTKGGAIQHFLDTPIADSDGDGTTDESDINIFTLDSDYDETDKSANISSFKVKYGVLNLDTALPTGDDELVIEYYTAKYPVDRMVEVTRRLTILYATNWLFITVPFEKLQRGISTWNINSVSVQFDAQVMKDTVESNKVLIKEILMRYKTFRAVPSTLQKLNSNDSYWKNFRNTLNFR